MNTHVYEYTVCVEINFDEVAEQYCLSKTSSFEDCKRVVHDYVTTLDDDQFYAIDNEREIAQDLYAYLQSKEE